MSEKRNVSRRRFLALSSAMVAVPLLSACTPAAPATPTATPAPAPPGTTPAPAPTTPASAIKRGGSLVQTINWTYPTLDPHMTTIKTLTGYDCMFNGLVRLELADPTTWEHKLVGDLAESWEQPDAQTIVFKLRKGVKFHDGTTFDANVAAWNLLRARDHDKSQTKAQLKVLEAAEAVDADTLRLKLTGPNVAFLRSSAVHFGALVPMISQAALEKQGDDGFARNPVGTGPFKFKQWVTDDRVILERNPDYYEQGEDGKSLPYLDEVVSRYIPDPSVALVDMRAGTVHVLEWLPTKDVDVVNADPNLELARMPWAGQAYFLVGFNSEAPPFNDVRVRQAAAMAIDREGMAQALGFGVGVPHYYPKFMSGALGYDESITKNEYNPARVKELLTEAGYPNGVEVELKVIAREPENTIGEYAQQMWSAVGIKTKLVAQERLSWIDAVRAKNFQACFWRGTFQSVVDPDLLKPRVTCGGEWNWAQWCDPEVDRLMTEGGISQDPAKRHEIYREVSRIIQERAYLASGIVMPLMTAYRKEVQDLRFNFQVPDLRRTWLKT